MMKTFRSYLTEAFTYEITKAYNKGKRKFSSDKRFRNGVKELESILKKAPSARTEDELTRIASVYNGHVIKGTSNRKGVGVLATYNDNFTLYQAHLTAGKYVMVWAQNNDKVVFILLGKHDDFTGG